MHRPNEFSRTTKLAALARQRHRCAACGTRISGLGIAAQEEHRWGESTVAHHRRHVKLGGSDRVDNCVILCWSCHYTAHEGGSFRFSTLICRRKDFEYFHG